ncbi:ribosomal-protein-S5-alanine N-acetyltransferase [Caulifigura coniformis]|uniref:Ribosomal-protein-S5-alanine N-acetyltransferase n=1 Tax=Caulifigura coniformis TaxID=2527983 RepID=A0A517SF55_9PLAN|nr:GNAT family N-acetyltransferase [Caulifigura coniformis]QDT54727.1 ribosomal-protein-S5-alanine N-acetyltransferase [Caulifigura coniformis]
MSKLPEITTERLLLRPWRRADRPHFAAVNADLRVVECLPGVLTREESDAFVDRIEAHFEKNGFGLWCVEAPGVAECLGFIGLSIPQFETHFTPCVEIGWRLGSQYWGQGYAPEGARAAMEFGFRTLGLHEIVSFTVPHNTRSRRVMEKIGMTRDEAGDFEHPRLAPGHPLRSHVLYRCRNPDGKAV